jgi:hypothetical protein
MINIEKDQPIEGGWIPSNSTVAITHGDESQLDSSPFVVVLFYGVMVRQPFNGI